MPNLATSELAGLPGRRARRAPSPSTPITVHDQPNEDERLPTTGELLTVAEVADWLRVEPRYVYRLASPGELDRVYVGRYVRKALGQASRSGTRVARGRESQ